MAQVIAQLNAIFQIDLPVLSLVESPTIAELARCIEDVFRLTCTGTRPDAHRGTT